MKARFTVILAAIAPWLASPALLSAQELRFNSVQLLTNREAVLKLAAPAGTNYRVEFSTNLPDWNSWLSFSGTSTFLQHTDSAAPYAVQRFYRASPLAATNVVTGDHLVTSDGDVVFRSVAHAGFVMSWQGKMIYNDPTNATLYQSFPRADLILISHDHGDHFNSTTVEAVRTANTRIVVPQYVYNNNLSAAQRALAIVLTNGASTNILGLTVEAVPAYNGNHPVGRGNGYVLTIGGKRIYMSGDTGNIAEMRALQNIDVAFLCMNYPYTMVAADATNAVRAFRPKVVYPYHFRDQSGTTTNAGVFKQWLGSDLGIEVRLRKWY
jgi:L-ascorbate metabolism protein UlaG (beta-lactamase superfamily)